MSSKIIAGPFKWVIHTPWGLMVGVRKKPRKIPGGYLTDNGRRYISNPAETRGHVRLTANNWNCI